MANLNEYGHDADLFNRVALNALNGLDHDNLTPEELRDHRAWVARQWDDLMEGTDD